MIFYNTGASQLDLSSHGDPEKMMKTNFHSFENGGNKYPTANSTVHL